MYVYLSLAIYTYIYIYIYIYMHIHVAGCIRLQLVIYMIVCLLASSNIKAYVLVRMEAPESMFINVE